MALSPYDKSPRDAHFASRGNHKALDQILRDLITAVSGKEATVAAAGSSASDATQLSAGYTIVTAADGTKGVALPAAEKGIIVVVVNSVNTAALPVYPVNGGNDNINSLAEDAAFNLGAGQTGVFIATSATQWYVNQAAAAPVAEEVYARAAVGAPGTRHCPFRLKRGGVLLNVTLRVNSTASGSAGTSANDIWEVLRNGVTMTAAAGLTAAVLTNSAGSTITFTINKMITSMSDVFELVNYTDTAVRPDAVWTYRPGQAISETV